MHKRKEKLIGKKEGNDWIWMKGSIVDSKETSRNQLNYSQIKLALAMKTEYWAFLLFVENIAFLHGKVFYEEV